MLFFKDSEYHLILKAIEYTLQFGYGDKEYDSKTRELWQALNVLRDKIKNRDVKKSNVVDITGKPYSL